MRRQSGDAARGDGTWNMFEGGSAIEWLHRKTTPSALPSTEAPGLDQTAVPKPRSQQRREYTEVPKTTATVNNPRVVRIAADGLRAIDLKNLLPLVGSGRSQENLPTTHPEASTVGRKAELCYSSATPHRELQHSSVSVPEDVQTKHEPRSEVCVPVSQSTQAVGLLTALQPPEPLLQPTESPQQQLYRQYVRQSGATVNHTADSIDLTMALEVIRTHDVTFICTDTGTGKSTSVPRALLEESNTNRIVSTQPRRTATINVAQRVSELRREPAGITVGYWIRGDRLGTEDTRLWYMTNYTFLLQLLDNPLAIPFTHIILDEFHERQPDLEVTVGLLKLCLKHHPKSFKLILMSATMSAEEWEPFFDGLSIAVYKQSEPEHPIYDYFLEDVCGLMGIQCPPPPTVPTPFVDHSMMEQHTVIAQNLVVCINSFAAPHHSILVFLPGRAQVEHVQMWLEANLSHRVDLIPWHSAVDLSTIQEALHRRSRKQKVYLATDIAEVSITLPEVVFVIDLVLLKRPHINPTEPTTVAAPPLWLQWGSKGNVTQRRGRVGRVQQGFYFCLAWKALVEDLPNFPLPPLQHARVEDLTLHGLQLCSVPTAVFALCHGRPLEQALLRALAQLRAMGCLLPWGDPLASVEGVEAELLRARMDGFFEGEKTKGWRSVFDTASVSKGQPRDGNTLHQRVEGGNERLSGQRREGAGETGVSGGEEGEGYTRPCSPLIRRAAEQVWRASTAGEGMMERYRCTFIGKLLQLLPVSLQQGLLVFYGFLTGLESLMILAAAVCNSVPPFCVHAEDWGKRRGRRNRSFNQRTEDMVRRMEETETLMQQYASDARSDVVAVMAAVLEVSGRRVAGSTQKELHHWCTHHHLSLEKIELILDLMHHIKYELGRFIPFRDVEDPKELTEQLKSVSALVIVLCNAAFASQALKVTAQGAVAREGAIGIFSDLRAVPDLHSPSCLRWESCDIIIPIVMSLHYSKLLVSCATAIGNHKQFWMSVLLFAYRIQYAFFSDESGKYAMFLVHYGGVKRVLECDAETAQRVLSFRSHCSKICATIRLRYRACDDTEEAFNNSLRKRWGWDPLDEQQRTAIGALLGLYGRTQAEASDIAEVDFDELELIDEVSTLSFALPQSYGDKSSPIKPTDFSEVSD